MAIVDPGPAPLQTIPASPEPHTRRLHQLVREEIDHSRDRGSPRTRSSQSQRGRGADVIVFSNPIGKRWAALVDVAVVTCAVRPLGDGQTECLAGLGVKGRRNTPGLPWNT
jgi:hypothetical protein